MNDIVTQSATMTSREIAVLTEKEHAHVMRDIRAMLEELKVAPDGYIQNWIHPLNSQSYNEFVLPKDLTMTLVSGYSVLLRHRIVTRLSELEAAHVPVIQLPITPPNFAAALRLAADQADEIATQREQLALAAPAVAFVEKFVDSTGLKGFRQVCKLLNANEAEFRTFLEDKKIMYRLGGEWTPHAQHLDTGRFSVKAGTSEVSGHAFNSARFTAKGVNWVAGEWAKYKLEAQTEVAL